jgi:hypothetical protein
MVLYLSLDTLQSYLLMVLYLSPCTGSRPKVSTYLLLSTGPVELSSTAGREGSYYGMTQPCRLPYYRRFLNRRCADRTAGQQTYLPPTAPIGSARFKHRSAGNAAVRAPDCLPPRLAGSRSGCSGGRHPRGGSFRLLCETGAAIGAAPGPPLPSAPSGTRAAKLKKCDEETRARGCSRLPVEALATHALFLFYTG